MVASLLRDMGERTEETEEETIVCFVTVNKKWHVIDIYQGDPPRPIEPRWVGISRVVRKSHRVPKGREKYWHSFYDEDGEELVSIPCDSLEIALDQAKAKFGIGQEEWKRCSIDVQEGYKVPWSQICKEG